MARTLFVIGFGRSGTTFLAKLLDSHPEVIYRHEPDSIIVDTQIPFAPDLEDLEPLFDRTRSYIEQLRRANNPKVSGHRPIFAKNYRSAFQQVRFQAAVYLTKTIGSANIPAFNRRLKIPDMIGQRTGIEPVCIIKTVNSLGRARLFSDLDPQYKFLHIVRHPCGVIESILRGAKAGLMERKAYLESAFRMRESRNYPFSFEHLVDRSFEEQYAFCWMVLNQKVQNEMREKPCYRMVRYEELCRDLSTLTPALFEFFGLSWHCQSARFITRIKTSKKAKFGYFDIVRPPLASVDRWRESLSESQIRRISDVVRHAPVGRQFLKN